MSSIQAHKARSGWLFSFGDLITLLITFFIMMIVLNKGEITRVQKWAESSLDQTYQQLNSEMQQSNLITLERNNLGIVVNINSDDAFVKGGFEASDQLKAELDQLGKTFNKLSLFQITEAEMPTQIAEFARKSGLEWRSEILVEGHTDNDAINPSSYIRNNWFLSTMRAQSVMGLLYESSGLAPDFFGVAGYGEFRPITSNASLAGKAQNRRVQLVISAAFEESGISKRVEN